MLNRAKPKDRLFRGRFSAPAHACAIHSPMVHPSLTDGTEIAVLMVLFHIYCSFRKSLISEEKDMISFQKYDCLTLSRLAFLGIDDQCRALCA